MVTVKQGEKTITLQVGNTKAQIDGADTTLDLSTKDLV
jgi:hypothetical protein